MGTKNIYERFVWFDNQVRTQKYPNATTLSELVEYIYLMSNGVVVHECDSNDLWQNTEIMAKYLGL